MQRLRELGWIEGRNVAIEYRWAEGRSERFAEIGGRVRSAQGRRHCHLLEPRLSSRQSRRHRPSPSFSRSAGDPVGSGLVASLARPGGNVTGLSTADGRACRQAARTLARGCPRAPPVGDHGQCRQSFGRTGNARGSGSGPQARPSRSLHSKFGDAEDIAPIFDGAQGPRRCTLRLSATRSWTPTATRIITLATEHAAADDVTSSRNTSKREV